MVHKMHPAWLSATDLSASEGFTQTRLPLPRLPRVAKHCGQGGTSGQVNADTFKYKETTEQ